MSAPEQPSRSEQETRALGRDSPDSAGSADSSGSSGSASVGSETLVLGDASGPGAPSQPGGAPDPEVGQTLGRYVLLDRIGAGGMGVVYAAYDPELDRRVALKVLRPVGERGASPTAGRSRILREAQALAKLSHPAVVSIFDVGTVEGQVFMAMEHIKGLTLRAWLAAEPRSWAEIVDVYLAAGRGLAAAHAAGLVHRDFKPDNALVSPDGRVRVVDFGLAKSAFLAPIGTIDSGEPAVEDRDGMTQVGFVMGTPAYMSPEQLAGRDVDPRGDQFSFCVALFRALYGRHPFLGGNRSDAEELLRRIKAGKIAARPPHSKVPAAVHAALCRGLSARPDERWPALPPLMDALDRARGRRWRRGAWLTAAVLGTATAVALLVPGRDDPCQHAAADIDRAWGTQRRQAVEAALLGTGVRHAPDTWQRVGARLDGHASAWTEHRVQACAAARQADADPTVAGRRIACLENRLTDLDALVEVLIEADADVVGRAVAAVAALDPASVCDRSNTVVTAADPVLAAQVREQLSRAKALESAGRYPEGRRMLETIAERLGPDGDPVLRAEVLVNLGNLQYRTDALEEGAKTLEEAALVATSVGHDAVAAIAQTDLVYMLGQNLARHDEALEWARHAQATIDRAGLRKAEITMLVNLGMTYIGLGRYDEAVASLEEGLRRQRANDPDDPKIAITLNNLGIAVSEQGDYEQARAWLEEAVKAREATLGPHHPELGSSLNNLGMVLNNLGRYDEARQKFGQAIEIMTDVLGPEHLNVAMTHSNMAVSYYDQGRHAEALPHYEGALDILETALGPDAPAVAKILGNIGLVLAQTGDLEQALKRHQRALEINRANFGEEHPAVAMALNNIGSAHRIGGDYDEARRHYEQALQIRKTTLGPRHAHTGTTVLNLAEVALAAGEPARAEDEARRALEIWEEAYGPNHGRTAWALTVLGEALIADGRASQSDPLLRRALKIYQGDPETSPDDRGRASFALGRAGLATGGDDAEIERWLAEAQRAYRAAGPQFSDELSRVRATRLRATRRRLARSAPRVVVDSEGPPAEPSTGP